MYSSKSQTIPRFFFVCWLYDGVVWIVHNFHSSQKFEFPSHFPNVHLWWKRKMVKRIFAKHFPLYTNLFKAIGVTKPCVGGHKVLFMPICTYIKKCTLRKLVSHQRWYHSIWRLIYITTYKYLFYKAPNMTNQVQVYKLLRLD